ncbi:MAG TPA: FtsX-like permease family protein [Acidobacteriaceae bacterium]|nr:FtsX-like permease family protein [Acidobacteriaceae bacterium]
MLNRLIFANLAHRPVRTLLSVLAIAVEVTMILTLVGVSYGTLDSSANRARGAGADIVIRPPNSSAMSSLNSTPIPDKYVAWLAGQPHVVAATGTAVMALGNGTLDSITGIDFPAFNKMSGGFVYLNGGDPANDTEIAMDEFYARQKHLHVGDSIQLVNHTWRVSGIYQDGKLTRMCVRLPALQAIMPGGEKHLTVLYAKLDDPKLADQAKEDLKEKLVNYPVYTMEEFVSMFNISNIGMLKDFIGVVIGVSVIVGFIVVFMAMYTAVLERTREIGIIKAVGGAPGLVLQMLMRETVLLALLGTVAGIALTYGTQWIMQHAVPGSLTQETVYLWWLYAGLIAVGGALLGVIVPAAKAMKQDVTEALSYE